MQRSHLPATGPGSRNLLPAAELLAHDRTRRALRRGRSVRVVFVRHDACAGCDAYLAALVSAARADSWGAEIVAIAAHLPGAPTPGVTWLEDPERATLGDPLRVIVADEWGEVFMSVDAAHEPELPSQRAVSEVVGYVAIQCPECEGPEGLWREL